MTPGGSVKGTDTRPALPSYLRHLKHEDEIVDAVEARGAETNLKDPAGTLLTEHLPLEHRTVAHWTVRCHVPT